MNKERRYVCVCVCLFLLYREGEMGWQLEGEVRPDMFVCLLEMRQKYQLVFMLMGKMQHRETHL